MLLLYLYESHSQACVSDMVIDLVINMRIDMVITVYNCLCLPNGNQPLIWKKDAESPALVMASAFLLTVGEMAAVIGNALT